MSLVLPREEEVEKMFSRILASRDACERLSETFYNHLCDDNRFIDSDPGHFAEVMLKAYENGDVSAVLLELCNRSMFDLLKEGETAECDPEDLGEIDGTRLQFQIGRTEEGLVNLKIELFQDEVVVQTEEIRERIYSPELVEQLLRQAGFQQVWCTDQLLRESEHAATWFVIARKSNPVRKL